MYLGTTAMLYATNASFHYNNANYKKAKEALLGYINYLKILQKKEEQVFPDTVYLTQIAFAYGRLSQLESKNGTPKLEHEYMQKAVDYLSKSLGENISEESFNRYFIEWQKGSDATSLSGITSDSRKHAGLTTR